MKKIVKFLIVCLVVLAVSFGALWILGLGVTPSESYVKSQMYEFYHASDIDTIFVGPSFVYRGINPEIVDSFCGTNSFNLGTSSQKPIDSYFVIKEAVRVQPIKTIVLDVSQDFYTSNQTENKSTFLVLDAMESSPVKKEYIREAFDIDDTPIVLFKAAHYDFPSMSGFIHNLKGNLAKNDKPKVIIQDMEGYYGKGYVYTNRTYKGDATERPDAGEIGEDSFIWLDRIIDFCNEKNIELIIIGSPKTSDYYAQKLYYKENAEKITEHCAERGYVYNNFDDHWDNEFFEDKKHLNSKGAEKYSGMITGLIKNKQV